MNNEKKMNNKGFSLVELIIVIAIMAVLIGVLAPQYMRYVERSRVAVDKDLASSLQSAMTTAMLDPNIPEADKPKTNGDIATNADATGNKFWKDVQTTMNVDNIKGLDNMLKSKRPDSGDGASGARLKYEVDALGNVTVKFSHSTGTEKVPNNDVTSGGDS